MRQILKAIESIIWEARIIVVVAVLASVISGLILFIYGSMDVVDLFKHFWSAIKGKSGWNKSSLQLIGVVASVSTIYLSAGLVYVLGIALYELFIGQMDSTSGFLKTGSLEELKDKVIKFVHIILVILFFRFALTINYNSAQNLMYLSIGIALIAGSVYLTKR